MSDSNKNQTNSRVVKCPACGIELIYNTHNSFRPFCTERCKNHDAASWADEEYRVPGERVSIETPDDEF